MARRESGHGHIGHELPDVSQVGDALLHYRVLAERRDCHGNIKDILGTLGRRDRDFFENIVTTLLGRGHLR